MNFNFLVEKKNKAYICEPKFGEWLNMANKNMINRNKWNFEVCGIKALQFKNIATKQILSCAHSFCAEKNIAVKEKDPHSYVFATGHQTVFYHPGVWIKNYLINEASYDDNIIGLNIWIDYEEGCHEEFPAPYYSDEKLQRKNILFNTPPCSNIAAAIDAPADNLWGNFTDEVKKYLKTLPGKDVLNNFDDFLAKAARVKSYAKNISEFIALSRRYYEENNAAKNYLELPVTSIVKQSGFLYFFLDIINKIEIFHLIYNDVLDKYRAENAVKNSANPFPNLRSQDNLFELPFWVILPPGARAVLWYDKDKNALYAKREKIIKLKDSVPENLELLQGSEYKIVFKAVALMMFFRVFICDFFLHGAGGASYDLVTNSIIRNFYKIEPPSYGAATLNLFLPFPEIQYNAKEIFEIEKKLIQLRHNPQKLIPQKTIDEKPHLKELIREKESLVRKIKNAPLDDKKIIADKIKKINSELEKEIKPLKTELEEKFKLLKEKERDFAVASFREYPFCFHDPKDLQAMVEKIKATTERTE